MKNSILRCTRGQNDFTRLAGARGYLGLHEQSATAREDPFERDTFDEGTHRMRDTFDEGTQPWSTFEGGHPRRAEANTDPIWPHAAGVSCADACQIGRNPVLKPEPPSSLVSSSLFSRL